MRKIKSRKSIWLEHTSQRKETLTHFLEDVGFDDMNEVNMNQACNAVGSCKYNIENWFV